MSGYKTAVACDFFIWADKYFDFLVEKGYIQAKGKTEAAGVQVGFAEELVRMNDRVSGITNKLAAMNTRAAEFGEELAEMNVRVNQLERNMLSPHTDMARLRMEATQKPSLDRISLLIGMNVLVLFIAVAVFVVVGRASGM
ncbi:hypothetical protein ACP4OV_013269 [Aristida adscensionis]